MAPDRTHATPQVDAYRHYKSPPLAAIMVYEPDVIRAPLNSWRRTPPPAAIMVNDPEVMRAPVSREEIVPTLQHNFNHYRLGGSSIGGGHPLWPEWSLRYIYFLSQLDGADDYRPKLTTSQVRCPLNTSPLPGPTVPPRRRRERYVFSAISRCARLLTLDKFCPRIRTWRVP